jgi:hypothetical protein
MDFHVAASCNALIQLVSYLDNESIHVLRRKGWANFPLGEAYLAAVVPKINLARPYVEVC